MWFLSWFLPMSTFLPVRRDALSLGLLLLQHLASGLGRFDLEVGHMTNACMIKGEVDL